MLNKKVIFINSNNNHDNYKSNVGGSKLSDVQTSGIVSILYNWNRELYEMRAASYWTDATHRPARPELRQTRNKKKDCSQWCTVLLFSGLSSMFLRTLGKCKYIIINNIYKYLNIEVSPTVLTRKVINVLTPHNNKTRFSC